MKTYMSHEEFLNCSTVSRKDINEILKDLNSKGITNVSEQIHYVKENYTGQLYMDFMLETLDKIIINNRHTINKNFTFSKSAIDGLLRSYLFAIEYMQEGLPEHVYYYTKTKIDLFVIQLLEEYKKNVEDI